MNKITIMMLALVLVLSACNPVGRVNDEETNSLEPDNSGDNWICGTPIVEAKNPTHTCTEEEARLIAEENCDGVLNEGQGNYNNNSRTWWFAITPTQENPNNVTCNPACVVWEETGETEINWMCLGSLPPIEEHICTDEEKAAEICTMEYAPVCGYKEVECFTEPCPPEEQCITAPCPPVGETYGNDCMACADDVDYWVSGECEE
ncbi:MAG: hypothetical protein ABH828_00285 [archaeon]